MATTPEALPHRGAHHPRVVLPITSRGVELTDRACTVILGVAMAIAAAVILYLNRGTTFYFDELAHVYASPNLHLADVIDPYNGHLSPVTRLYYKGMLEVFGADYLVFRVVHVATVLAVAGLLYAVVKRRIGALPALAPALVLLFFGSAWVHFANPQGFGIALSIALGLAALLALERGDRVGEIAASALLIVSIATYTAGLAFAVGVAISVLLRQDRWRRAWIFLIPLGLYAVWWLWSQGSAEGATEQTTLSNVLVIPTYVAESIAVVIAALVGLGYDFSRIDMSIEVDPAWGQVIGLVAVAALALHIRRGSANPSLWASLGIVLTFWALGALVAGTNRGPGDDRYMYMGAIGVLLVATDAARGVRFSKRGLMALFAVCAIGICTNLALLRDGTAFFRDAHSVPVRADFAVLELARGNVDPEFDPTVGLIPVNAATYFQVADQYGSLAMPLSELEQQSEPARERADQTLVDALELRVRPSSSVATGANCETLSGEAVAEPAGFELPPGGASIRVESATPGKVSVARFGLAPAAPVGTIAPGETGVLRIPEDASAVPWRAYVGDARSVEICALD